MNYQYGCNAITERKKEIGSSSALALAVALALAFPGPAALASREPIPGIDIIVQKKPGGIAVVTPVDASGKFSVRLEPGQYTVSTACRQSACANHTISATYQGDANFTPKPSADGATTYELTVGNGGPFVLSGQIQSAASSRMSANEASAAGALKTRTATVTVTPVNGPPSIAGAPSVAVIGGVAAAATVGGLAAPDAIPPPLTNAKAGESPSRTGVIELSEPEPSRIDDANSALGSVSTTRGIDVKPGDPEVGPPSTTVNTSTSNIKRPSKGGGEKSVAAESPHIFLKPPVTAPRGGDGIFPGKVAENESPIPQDRTTRGIDVKPGGQSDGPAGAAQVTHIIRAIISTPFPTGIPVGLDHGTGDTQGGADVDGKLPGLALTPFVVNQGGFDTGSAVREGVNTNPNTNNSESGIASGTTLPQVNIQIFLNTNVTSRGIATTTDANGAFKFDKLPPGNYQLSIAGQPSQSVTVGADGIISGEVMSSSAGEGSGTRVIRITNVRANANVPGVARTPPDDGNIFDRWGNRATAPTIVPAAGVDKYDRWGNSGIPGIPGSPGSYGISGMSGSSGIPGAVAGPGAGRPAAGPVGVMGPAAGPAMRR